MSFHPVLWRDWKPTDPFTDEMAREIAICVNHNAQGVSFRPGVFGCFNQGDHLCLAMAGLLDKWCEATGYNNTPEPSFETWLETALSPPEEPFKPLIMAIFNHIDLPDWDAYKKRMEAMRERMKGPMVIKIPRITNPDGTLKTWPKIDA